MNRVWTTIVLDGVGIGAQPDAPAYGDEGSHTLGHVLEQARPSLPNLEQLGLGNITSLPHLPPVPQPHAHYGMMREVSAGKDSTTGHWELAGLYLERPFPTYPHGFPPDLIERFIHETGVGGVLGNKPASGTAIIEEFGPKHEQTGWPIVYTSADSVFQIAAHKEVIPLEELYRICQITRDRVCVGEHAVGRVIARPFIGTPGNYRRVSAERKDYALPPPAPPLQQHLQRAGVRTISVGKVADLFGGLGFDEKHKTRSNEQGIAATLDAMQQATARENSSFIWTNLVDFDQEYGHRNDVAGFARALEAFDAAIPSLLRLLREEDVLVITADHGNDPTTPSTDHSREYVPLLVVVGGQTYGSNLGLRKTFADHAATVAEYFHTPGIHRGTSFLASILKP